MIRSVMMASLGALVLGGVALAQDGRRGDSDGDGRISREEFVAAHTARLAGVDTDGNGTVTVEELQAAHAARREARAERRFERIDTDGSGQISREEFEDAHMGRGHGRRGGEALAEHIGDGLTVAEIEARAADRFARIDADGDGYVTAEERRALRLHRRHGGDGATE